MPVVRLLPARASEDEADEEEDEEKEEDCDEAAAAEDSKGSLEEEAEEDEDADEETAEDDFVRSCVLVRMPEPNILEETSSPVEVDCASGRCLNAAASAADLLQSNRVSRASWRATPVSHRGTETSSLALEPTKTAAAASKSNSAKSGPSVMIHIN